MLKKALALCAATVAVVGMNQITDAATLTFTNPSQVAGDATPIATTAQVDIGNGSWQAAPSKSSIYLTPGMLGFSSPLSISALTSISWDTYKTAADGANDWYLTIYTNPTSSGDAASWYHNRITFEARYAYNYSDPTNTWVTWSTNSGTNQVTFYDDKNGGTAGGFSNGPTLSDLMSGTVNWSDYSGSGSTTQIDYSGDTVKFFTLQTASGWSPAYQGYVDNLQIGTTSGDVQANFDVVPLPATLPAGLALLGLCGVGLVIRRRRKAA